MRSIRCVAGLHAWERHAVREEGGYMALHQRCTRCGAVRVRSASSDPKQVPDTSRSTMPREYDSPW